ncbi:alanine racemase [Acidaminobacter hydrogenoformans]|uniref:Alanine racemase n=1 Tax=Acidaminobacter hydrogenoformans DSM 2784 TaxID=1120920 RepID=A0A1G5RU30_9FIRM|nr:alanine racemase [Acidaminobacter hydrogenoformans]SCZ77635.1 alanine racemase [Acidaminobacter hydrogenoformans DSM 2784]
MDKIMRPTWAEINLDHLAHNIREVRHHIKPESKILAVVKSDAYGHGAVSVAKTLLDNGADRLAVAILTEAMQLRKVFPDTDIMILGFTPSDQADILVKYNLTQTLYDLETAKQYNEKAVALGKRIKVHLKLETGMGRIGMMPGEQTISDILKISEMPGLEIEGIFTHFAVADELDKTSTMKQIESFIYMIKKLVNNGIVIPICHVSNSAGIIDLPEYCMDMVRPGIMLYGLYPSGKVSHSSIRLKEVMTLKTRIAHIKDLPPGYGISYGHQYFTRGDERIATLPIGYADGFSRMLSGKASVLIRNQRVPVVGRICMDQCMVNVTGLDVGVGESVTVFGGDETNKIWIEDMADWLGTNTHEIICRIDKRIPRVYIMNGKVVDVKDYLQVL